MDLAEERRMCFRPGVSILTLYICRTSVSWCTVAENFIISNFMKQQRFPSLKSWLQFALWGLSVISECIFIVGRCYFLYLGSRLSFLEYRFIIQTIICGFLLSTRVLKYHSKNTYSAFLLRLKGVAISVLANDKERGEETVAWSTHYFFLLHHSVLLKRTWQLPLLEACVP